MSGVGPKPIGAEIDARSRSKSELFSRRFLTAIQSSQSYFVQQGTSMLPAATTLNGRKPDEIQIRTSRIGHFRRCSNFDRSRFSHAARPLGTVPVFERRERCSGLRSARLRPHKARVSAWGLRRPPPLCTSRLRIPSRLSPVLILKGASALFAADVPSRSNCACVVGKEMLRRPIAKATEGRWHSDWRPL